METPKVSEAAEQFVTATKELINVWHERPLCRECITADMKARMSGLAVDLLQLLHGTIRCEPGSSRLLRELSSAVDSTMLSTAASSETVNEMPLDVEDDVERAELPPLPEHAAFLLSSIADRIAAWRAMPADDLDGPDYLLSRLEGLAASMVSLLDCAGNEFETVDALYELNEVRDFTTLLRNEGGDSPSK